MAGAFLSSLSKVLTNDLPTDCKTCTICGDEYYMAPGTDKAAEHAVRLPCSHIVGAECIAKWLTERSNSCPYCRREFFPRTPTERMLQLGDDALFLDDGFGNGLDPDSDLRHTEANGATDRQRVHELFLHYSLTLVHEISHTTWPTNERDH